MATTSLRERNKLDKAHRIRMAARYLFETKGFEDTSTRQIAARAKVGLATLFLYASDKRDLLFLACNDELEELTERAFARVDRETSILEQVCTAFSFFFQFYGRNRSLSRDLLRELTFYTSGRQSVRFQQTRQRTIGRIGELVAMARERGALTSPRPDDEIAQVIFYVFAAEVRRWLANEHETVADGISRFSRLVGIVVSGLT